jgi:hypothetical protein
MAWRVLALLVTALRAQSAQSPFRAGAYQVERTFAVLFSAPVRSEMSFVAQQLNAFANVTCHGPYTGRDLLEIEEILAAPLDKVEQAFKFAGIDLKSAGMRNKKKNRLAAGLHDQWSTEAVAQQQAFSTVGFVQSVGDVWRSIARLCEPFHMRVVFVERERVAHALSRLLERANQSLPFVVNPLELIDELDVVDRDAALMQWLRREMAPGCATTIDLEQFADDPASGARRLLAFFESRGAAVRTQFNVTAPPAIRRRADFAAMTANWMALQRRLKTVPGGAL